LAVSGLLLWGGIRCRQIGRRVQIDREFTRANDFRNLESYPANEHRSNEPHEPLRFSKLSSTNGIDDDDEQIMQTVIDILNA
jgi:hypothetical protein